MVKKDTTNMISVLCRQMFWGTVYENYLGYKLSQSAKGLKLHKDAEKRKEQGIYYTPAFIR